jgi:hypothetical protein
VHKIDDQSNVMIEKSGKPEALKKTLRIRLRLDAQGYKRATNAAFNPLRTSAAALSPLLIAPSI